MITLKIKEILEKEGFAVCSFRGKSMNPLLLENRDTVKLEKLLKDDVVLPGDIVLFERKNGSLVLHRVMKIKGRKLEICGDNCLFGELVSRDRIIAKMPGFYLSGKYVSLDDTEYAEYGKELLHSYEKKKEKAKKKYIEEHGRMRYILHIIKQKIL